MADSPSGFPDFLPYSADEAKTFSPAGSQASAAPVAQDNTAAEAPDFLPYSASDVKDLMASDPWHVPTKDQARLLYDEERNKPMSDRLGEFWTGVKQGAKGIAKSISDMHEEMSGVPITRNNLDRIGSTLFEAGAEGYQQDRALVKKVGRYVGDKIGETFANADEEQQFENFYRRILADRQESLRTPNLPAQRPADFNASAPRFALSPEFYRDGGIFSSEPAPPFPKAAAASSLILDPLALSAGPLSGATRAGVKVAAPVVLNTVLKAADKIPGGMAAVEKASLALDKAVPAAEAVNNIRNQATAIPERVASKVPGVLATAGRVAKNAASFPGELTKSIFDRIIPEAGREQAEKLLKLVTAAGLVEHSTPFGKAVVALQGLKSTGLSVEKLGQFAEQLSKLPADSQVPRLLMLANSETAPAWMRGVARGLYNTGAGKAVETVTEAAKAIAHGGAAGAVLGEMTGEDPAAQGQFAGSGMALGGLGRLEKGVTGQVAEAHHARALAGDFDRFIDNLRQNGASDQTIDRIKSDPKLTFQAMQAATARGILHGKLDFAFLPREEYNATIEGTGGQDSAAYFSPAENKIYLNIDATRAPLGHELAHRIAEFGGGMPEVSLIVNSVFSPEEQNAMKREYAEKMVKGQLAANGQSLLPQKNPKSFAKLVDDQVARLDMREDFLPSEIFAEAAYSALFNKDLTKQMEQSNFGRRTRDEINRRLDSSNFWVRMPESIRTIGRAMLGVEPSGVPNQLFSNPRIYSDQTLRRLLYDRLRQIRKHGTSVASAKEGKDGLPPGIPVDKDLYGKSEAVPMEPNPSTGRLENDAAVMDEKTGEVTLRKPSEIRRIERTRQAETKKAFEAIPPKPKNDQTPEVAPRIQSDGSVEIIGTRLSDQIDRMPQFGEEARKTAAIADSIMGSGDVLDLWYQAISRSSNWAAGVRKQLGNIAAQKLRIAPFGYKVSKEGNILVNCISLAAFDRKLKQWASEEKLGLWNGDTDAFVGDAKRYLMNHAQGSPGEEGIGTAKRDMLNVFILGYNKSYKDFNPLREQLKGDDRKGVLRSLRLDRIASVKIDSDSGWSYNHESMVKNLSPSSEPIPAAPVAEPPTSPKNENALSSDIVRDDLNDAGFYSAAERAITEKMPNRAPAAQVRAILRNPSNGIRADELKWSGIDSLLDQQKLLTKDEVLSFLKNNRVQINEITLGDGALHQFGTPEEQKDALEQLQRAQEKQWNKSLGPEDHLSAQKEYWAAYRNAVDKVPGFKKKLGDEANPTQYEDFQLPGGDNYREVLFILPLLPERESGPWVNEHYAVPKLIAHVRFSDRVDTEGKKVRLLDEIQSDRFQYGRKHGYQLTTPEQIRMEELSRKAKVSELDGAERGELQELESRADQDDSLPSDSPFKTTWHELVLKRMLRLAAEQGFDKLAWTTGDQQASRYELNKHFDTLKARKLADGGFLIQAFDKNGEPVIDEEFVAEDLPGEIGNTLAERVINQKAKTQTYTKLDLKIGGEGMRSFYDKILVDFMNKYGKKWGAKVGSTDLPLPPEEGAEAGTFATVHSVDITPAMKQAVLNQGQPQYSPEQSGQPTMQSTPAKRDFRAEARRRIEARKAIIVPRIPTNNQDD
jgi:hypothetical protein